MWLFNLTRASLQNLIRIDQIICNSNVTESLNQEYNRFPCVFLPVRVLMWANDPSQPLALLGPICMENPLHAKSWVPPLIQLAWRIFCMQITGANPWVHLRDCFPSRV